MKTLKIANLIALMLLFTPFLFIKGCDEPEKQIETTDSADIAPLSQDSVQIATQSTDSVRVSSPAPSASDEISSFWQTCIFYETSEGLYVTGISFLYGFCSSLIEDNLSEQSWETIGIPLSFFLYVFTLVRLLRRKYAYLSVLYGVSFLSTASVFGYYTWAFMDSEDHLVWGFYLYVLNSLFLVVWAFRKLPFLLSATSSHSKNPSTI